MPAVLHYVDLTLPELQALDDTKTIFLLSVSPIEAHGPHLPVGTDVFIAQELQRRYVEQLTAKYPDYQLVLVPDLYCGSDALPVAGSLSVRGTALEAIILDYAKGLAKQGFKYLFLADNHGGPRHQMALYRASKRAWRCWRFSVISPFNLVFRYMVQHDTKFLEATGLVPGSCGDDADAHAGTNETSLLLAVDPAQVADQASIPASLPPAPKGLASLVYRLGTLFGKTDWGKDLRHLANTLAWVSEENMLPYMGDPAKATAAAGEAMLNARVDVAMELFAQALSGQLGPVGLGKPMLYWLSWLVRLPED